MTEREIFVAALHQPTPADRVAFLDRACAGDAPLRERIEGLLREHAELGSFLDRPASPEPGTGAYSPSAAPEPPEAPGTRIGPYKLLQRLGEGGMGTVYMAEQEEPVRRTVAIKFIKPGMDSRQVLARFEAERQALALMDHPNIAKVLDAGTTGSEAEAQRGASHDSPRCASASGRPYFVMELVKGIPVTRFCDEHHLTPRERLELFVPVCQAVQHAHQKGIIHRDLKPSNVLVALYDDRPVPKVIDSGVAKAAGERLTDLTMFTEFGAVVGTLEYMSPEQARLNALDVDTRTDVYALAVILYELLTGSTPLTRKRLKEAALDELLRIIREEEPQKPSTRLSGSAELPSIAANRRTEPKKLGKLVRGELDWVVMKALEKDRARRYETANGLARDLQRYLADEPVEACPPSASYRLRKFARKHRAAFATAAAFVLLLTTAAVVSTALAMWAIRSERLAEIREQQATADRDTAQKERRRAEDSEAKAQNSLYIANINRVRFELENNNVGAARQLLDLYREAPSDRDPRGWEWYYWDRACHGEIYTLQAHSGTITDLVFSPDGALLASAVGGANPALKLWDTVTGVEVRDVKLSGQVSDVAFRPDGQVLAGRTAAGVTF